VLPVGAARGLGWGVRRADVGPAARGVCEGRRLNALRDDLTAEPVKIAGGGAARDCYQAPPPATVFQHPLENSEILEYPYAFFKRTFVVIRRIKYSCT
jgi:hypothetical protein